MKRHAVFCEQRVAGSNLKAPRFFVLGRDAYSHGLRQGGWLRFGPLNVSAGEL